MADLIQFHCPACGVTLRLPLSMAGSKGPCPRCARLILAPEPERGLGARILPTRIETPLQEPQEIAVTDAPAPVKVDEVPAGVLPPPANPQVPADQARPHLAIFVLSLALTAIISLAAGFLLGSRKQGNLTDELPLPPVVRASSHVDPEIPAPPKVMLVKPPVEPTAVEPIPSVPGPEAGKPGNVQSSVAAETALKAFLAAPDWMTRSAYAMFPGRVRPAMETYSHRVPDGPMKFTEIKRQDAILDQETGTSYFVFYVFTDKHPHGIPTVVAETKSGWLVDWEAFVEFRDEHFKAFAEGPTGQTGRFHLLVSVPPAPRAANTENEYFASFLIGPPGTEAARIAYVRKNSEAFVKLSDSLKSNEVFAPVLDVAKRATPDGKTFLEISTVVAPRWLPAAAE